MCVTVILFLIYSFSTVCESLLVDVLTQCVREDLECQRGNINQIIKYISVNGCEECGVPVADPYHFRNYHEPFILVDVTLTDGCFIGLRTCDFISYVNNPLTGGRTLQAICNLEIKSEYVFQSQPTLLDPLLFGGQRIAHGNGNATAKFVKLHVTLQVSPYLEKAQDGLTYTKFGRDSYAYTLDDFELHPDDVHVGNQDVTKAADQFINANWRILFPIYGDRWVKRAMKEFFYYRDITYSCIPAEKYLFL